MKFTYLIFIFLSFFKLYINAQNCTVNADVDKFICANEPLTLTGSIAGSTGSGTTIWTKISGPACSIVSPTSLSTSVINFVAGTYVFQISKTCLDGNLSSDRVTITVKPITIANAGRDTIFCPGNHLLNGNGLGANETAVWTPIFSSGSTVNLTGNINYPNASINSQTGSYLQYDSNIFTWIITNTNGCSSRDNVMIKNYGSLNPVNAGSDQILPVCYNVDRLFTLNPSFGGYANNGQYGIWSLASGPNVPTFITDSTRYVNTGGYYVVSGASDGIIPGTYTFVWTVKGPCVNGIDTVVVTIPPGPPNPVIRVVTLNPNPVCRGSNVPIFATATPSLGANEVGLWLVTPSNNVTILSPTKDTTTILNMTSSLHSTVNFVITNTVTGCVQTSSRASFDLLDTAQIKPATIIIPKLDSVLVCSALTSVLNYTANSVIGTKLVITGTYLSGGYLPNNSSATSYTFNSFPVSNTTFAFSNPGVYQFNFEIIYPTGSNCLRGPNDTIVKTMTVTVSGNPSASSAGSNQNLACGVITTNLIGNQPTTGKGLWTQVSGPSNATIASPTIRNTSITNLTPGIYKFRWTISDGPACTSQVSDVIVYVSGGPLPPANAGIDKKICDSTSLQLQGSVPTLGATGVWSASPNNGIIFSDNTSETSTLSNLLSNTTYTLTWDVTNACGAVSDVVLITTGPVTGAFPATVGANKCLITDSTTINLDAFTPVLAQGSWLQIAGQNVAIITNSTSANTTATGITNGIYQFQWAVTTVGCDLQTLDTLSIRISNIKTPLLNLGNDTTLCSVKSLQLNAGRGFKTYTWNNNITDSLNTIIAPGTFFVVVTDFCDNIIKDTITIKTDTLNALNLNNPPFVCTSEFVILNITDTNYVKYKWYPSDYIMCDTCKATTAFPLVNITYTLIATKKSGCISTDSIKIVLNNDCPYEIIIPNIITTNKDGVNDLFKIKNIERLPDNHLLIYNRWGLKIFDEYNYKNTWDGTPYNNGTYFYILSSSIFKKEFTGFVTLFSASN